MKTTTRTVTLLVAGVVVGSAMVACSSGGSASSGGSLASGGTFNIATPQDPGNLDPQRSLGASNAALNLLAYDTLVSVDSKNNLQPAVLTSWTPEGTSKWVLTVRNGVTCADGSAMDAKTVADNLNYVGNPTNKNAFAGVAVPKGTTATADIQASTVTATLTKPSSFFVQNLSRLSLVCEKGLTDRSQLAAASAGSGPYVISQVVPGSKIEYTLRQGYAWGPPGNGTVSVSGIPAKIVVQIVPTPTTTANLLISGQLNAAIVQGADEKRLQSAHLFSSGTSTMGDEIFFHQAPGAPVADVAVRRALVQALNLGQLAAVDTGGLGAQATGLEASPKVCPGNTVAGNLPDYNMDAAMTALTNDGWTPGSNGIREKNGQSLNVTLYHRAGLPGSAAAAQLISAQWSKLGASVSIMQKPADQILTVLFGTSTQWDVVLNPIMATNPELIVPFVSGDAPPKGQNFTNTQNEAYNSAVQTASREAGTTGCSQWNAAEGQLLKDADIPPIATIPYLWYVNKARFDTDANGRILPTTIRMYS